MIATKKNGTGNEYGRVRQDLLLASIYFRCPRQTAGKEIIVIYDPVPAIHKKGLVDRVEFLVSSPTLGLNSLAFQRDWLYQTVSDMNSETLESLLDAKQEALSERGIGFALAMHLAKR